MKKDHYSKEDAELLKEQEQKGFNLHFHIHEYPDKDGYNYNLSQTEKHVSVPSPMVTLFFIACLIIAMLACVSLLV